jgi:hypothetical protein
VGLANLLSTQLEADVSRKRSAMDASRGTRHWKTGVVLLLISLFSVAGLAKRSFCLPRSSDSHWISQACKMYESRRTSVPSVSAGPAPIIARSQPLYLVSSPLKTGTGHRAPPPKPGFIFDPSLRAPPSRVI